VESQLAAWWIGTWQQQNFLQALLTPNESLGPLLNNIMHSYNAYQFFESKPCIKLENNYYLDLNLMCEYTIEKTIHKIEWK